MTDFLLSLKVLNGGIFELKDFERKIFLFARGYLMAEVRKNGESIVIPHFFPETWPSNSLYKLACLETILALREKNINFKDDPAYTGELPVDIEEEIRRVEARRMEPDVCFECIGPVCFINYP